MTKKQLPTYSSTELNIEMRLQQNGANKNNFAIIFRGMSPEHACLLNR